MAKENEPNWKHEEAPSGTLSGDDLIAYLNRNKSIFCHLSLYL